MLQCLMSFNSTPRLGNVLILGSFLCFFPDNSICQSKVLQLTLVKHVLRVLWLYELDDTYNLVCTLWVVHFTNAATPLNLAIITDTLSDSNAIQIDHGIFLVVNINASLSKRKIFSPVHDVVHDGI